MYMMAKDVMNVVEARRSLSRLIKQVSQGGRPVAIGPRGKPAAILVGAEEFAALRERRAASSARTLKDLRLELTSSPEAVDNELRDIRRDFGANLARRAARLADRPARRRQ